MLKHSSANEIQWRNIKKVVRAIADFNFGNPPDPKWEVAHACVVNALTAKDGLGKIELEPLPQSEGFDMWGNFASYLLDKCEGEVITEEFLQHTLAAMMRDPQYNGGMLSRDARRWGQLNEAFKDAPDIAPLKMSK